MNAQFDPNFVEEEKKEEDNRSFAEVMTAKTQKEQKYIDANKPKGGESIEDRKARL